MRLSLRAVCSFGALALLCAVAPAQQPAKPKLYNTAKQKLLEGKQVFSFTQSKFDIADYCEKAKHYDYTWFDSTDSQSDYQEHRITAGVELRR